jgi:hypothetical protein
MMKVSRREAGELNVRNSFVGEKLALPAGAVSLVIGESHWMRFPLTLARARGSMDLRRR